ncbi:hypothetical protein DC487_14665 [Sphingobacterium corticibacter]|uniref:Uncharacterized protein n=1 Tax=Sphingobacterium corticibacter TaxID=2171749 RepID=A0A2T8HFY5_9SPHI|nr:hypothetical protein DC487_14665 [Sphingobacterium corticibacter]
MDFGFILGSIVFVYLIIYLKGEIIYFFITFTGVNILKSSYLLFFRGIDYFLLFPYDFEGMIGCSSHDFSLF